MDREIAPTYGVERAVAMLHDITPSVLREAWGEFFIPVDWMELPPPDADATWSERMVDQLEVWNALGVRAIKCRSNPKRGRPAVWLDDPRITPVFERAAALHLPVMIHIADPDCFWPEPFDPAVVGPKLDYYRPVEAVLERHPNLTVIGAHMAGIPENLPYLESLFERFPNLHVDLSATKWIVRELGRRATEAHDLLIRFAHRILFGSDLVVMLTAEHPDYYASRLHVLRTFLESDTPQPSMIFDPHATGPDFPDGAWIHPLFLPTDVLQSIYRDNAIRVFGLKP